MDYKASTQTDVALSLYKQLLAEASDSNLVFSPLSLHVVLSLTAAGSGGRTRSELLSFLKSPSTECLDSYASEIAAVLSDGSPASGTKRWFDGGPKPWFSRGPKLSFANGLWLDSSLSLKQSFKQVVDTSYKAATNLADFKTKAAEVTREVNGWAEKETGGLIKEILPAGSVHSLTRLIFANALYFKGEWVQKFKKSKTADAEFHLLDGSSVLVPFMTSEEMQAVDDFDGFKVLQLPYRQGSDERNFSMYLFLPDAKDGLPSLAEKVCSEPGFLEGHLPEEKVFVGEFKVPRFKICFGFEASEVLRKLGVVSPFDPRGGDLTEMVEESEVGRELRVSKIFHKSFIEVNEKGTKAAAASDEPTSPGCSPVEIDFVADHPFLFLIRENKSGMVLFIGQVLNPSTA